MTKPDMKIKMGPPCFPGIKDLDEGSKIDESQIIDICSYISLRYDCADFRMVSIIRTLYSYTEQLSKETVELMKKTVLDFKYWMDEPGEDSMCYWSENHQILFASIEYLAGQLYPDEVFTNTNMTGREHKDKAEKRIQNWLRYRFIYGFTEWHSNVYYEEDIAPISLLIDFSKDETIVTKSKIIMDIILLDIAMFSWKGLFSASSGRCYKLQKMNPMEQSTLQVTESVWGFKNIHKYDYSRMSSGFLLSKKYDIPDVIKDIGKDYNGIEIKDSMGLDLKEIKKEFTDLNDIDTTGMFMWAMESFTNPESVNMAIKVFNEWNLHNNSFLKDFKMINIKALIKLKLLPLVARILNPVTQGIAIQRANTYIYKTNYYTMSTAQDHHPGEFGDQQHIWQATLSDKITVFTTHPGSPAFSDIDRNFSPDYWVGNGILPHSVQHKNVHLSIYDLSGRKGFMEKERLMFTHAYFPQDKFDEVILEGKYLFGRIKGAYIALIGRNPLKFNTDDNTDCIQEGKVTYWVCKLGTKEQYCSFEKFKENMQNLKIEFKNRKLTVKGTDTYTLKYKGKFSVNDIPADTNYTRLGSPYGNIERKPKEIRIKSKDKYLYLNFDKLVREHGSVVENQERKRK